MTTNASTGSDGRFRCERTSQVDSVHDMVPPSTGISNRRCVSVPEVSSSVWTRPSTEYMCGSATACSTTMDTNYTQSSDSDVPPITSRQRSQLHTGPLQSRPSTAPVFPPPHNFYHAPHQGIPGTHARPDGLASALTDPSPHPASAPPVTQRGSFVAHQRTLSNAHPYLHMAHPPPFAYPRHMGSPRQEENMHYLAYVSPSMMTPLRPHAVYQYQTPPDHVPTPSHIFPSSTSAPTSPLYPHTPINTSPTMSGSSSGAHRSVPYATHSAYTPTGYASPPPYAYPSSASFVPPPSIYAPHYQPYGFPTGQESQGTWWYSPPGATPVSHSSFEGTQREYQPWLTAGHPPDGQLGGEQFSQRNSVSLPSEPQPTRRPTNQSIGSPLNEAMREVTTPSPTTSPSGKNKHQERRSYHPNPPAHRSDWVMWAGNVPSDVTHDELREFFNQPLTPLSPKQTEPSKDSQQVCGGVSTVFLISRSNCAFVNFESEAQLEAATVRFNGQPIRPDDQRCPRLVCRVRRMEDDLMAGVGAQRGSAVHIKWVKEQKAKVQREQADTVGSPKDVARPSSPLSVSHDDSRGTGEGHGSNLSRSASVASTNSDILTRYFPQRYFILKSLTQHDLDLSVQQNVWATQRHNEEILDQAYRTSEDVFLIFSVNKSGEFYGYARMTGLASQDEIGVPWASATGSTAPPSSVSSLSEMSGAYVSPDDTGAKRQDPFYIIPVDRQTTDDPRNSYKRLTNSMPRRSTSLPRTVVPVQATSSGLSFDALSHALESRPARGTRKRESAGHNTIPVHILVGREVSEPDLGDRAKPVFEVPFEGRDTRDDDTGSGWGRPFRIEWIRTYNLPFFRTRHLRNPWNHGREVKVSRDGTELEPAIGQQLLNEWDRPSVVVDSSSGPSRTTERRRDPKPTHHTP